MSTARLVQTFTELVRIDSPSLHEAGVASLLVLELTAAGFDVHVDDAGVGTGADTGNVIGELPGDLPATVILSAHMDTVEPGRGIVPVERDGAIHSEGATILGADDKVGIAAILEAIKRMLASGQPHPTIRVIFSVAEEIGLRGAKELDPAMGVADLCLVLDAAGPPGAIITSSPTHWTFTAHFQGRAAHAGVAPENGVSAIHMAADAIMRMRLGRLDELTTANVGSITGGSATNVVTPHVKMTGECRSQDRPTVEAVRAEMEEAMRGAALDAGGTVDVEWTLEYEGFRHDEDDPDLALMFDAVRDIGLEPHASATGGGSDANIIAAWGTSTFAVGCGMQGMHTTDEHVAIEDLEAMTQLVMAVVSRVAARAAQEA